MGTVYRTAQLEELGITKHHRALLVQAGKLHVVDRGVYCTDTPRGEQLLRALLLTRPHLAYSGRTARELYGGYAVSTPAHAQVARPHNYRTTELLRVTQVRAMTVRTVKGLPVVPPVAAVLDLLGDSDDLVRASVFLEKQYAGRAGHDNLTADLQTLGRVPAALRKVIATSAVGADSNSERILFRALKMQGVEVIQNHRLGHYHWDAAIPAARILIELDSHRYHAARDDGTNRRTFIVDRWKANDGARRGWLVLRYTGDCVYRHLDKVVQQIMDTVRWRTGADRAHLTRLTPPQQLPFEEQPLWEWHVSLASGRGHSADAEPPVRDPTEDPRR